MSTALNQMRKVPQNKITKLLTLKIGELIYMNEFEKGHLRTIWERQGFRLKKDLLLQGYVRVQ